jgi:tetratricopeptide (TPR) repeat protein
LARALLNDTVIEKVASLALGCCVAGGVLTLSTAAAPVVGGAVSLAAVLTTLGLKRLIRDKPECEKALTSVQRALAKDFIQRGDADEASVRSAMLAFDAALKPEAVFTAEALTKALAAEARVVPALTGHVLADMATRDPRFGEAGLPRDLAEQVLTEAFARSVEACPPFKDRADLVLAEVTLDEVRGLGEQMAVEFAQAEERAEVRHQELLEAIGAAGLQRAEEEGLSKDQVQALLMAFAHENMPVDQAETLLLKAAEELIALRNRLAQLSNDEPEIAALLHAAAEAIDAADLPRADELLTRAEHADLAEGQRRFSRAAETMERRGDLARSQSRLVEAAAHYGRAADLLTTLDAEEAWRLRFTQADVLDDHGTLFPGPSIAEAVRILRGLCLPHTPRETRPTEWAMTQNNLGTALVTLGRRAGGQAGAKALNEAVKAYRAALEIYTRADRPTEWATTKNNLGAALSTLDERIGGEAGITALNEAVEAYREALEVRTRVDLPADWAMTQNNLGNALQTLAKRAGAGAGITALKEAVNIYRAVSDVYTRADMPGQWAMTQNNLGAALRTLGRWSGEEEGIVALNEAADHYRAALEIYTSADAPADWAMTQNNLGNALSTVGERSESRTAITLLNQALDAFHAALDVYVRTSMPAQWALTTANLAVAQDILSRKSGDPAAACAAAESMIEVIAEFEAMQATAWVEQAKSIRANLIQTCRDLGGTCAD